VRSGRVAEAIVRQKAEDARDGKNSDVAMARFPHPLNGGSQGDELVACGGGHLGTKVLVHKSNGELLRTFAGHEDEVEFVAISCTGELLVSGAADGLRTWNPVKGLTLCHLKTDGKVTALAVSQAGCTIASATKGAVNVWSRAEGASEGDFQVLSTISADKWLGPRGVALSGDGSRLAFVQGNSIVVRERARGNLPYQDEWLVLKGHTGLVNALQLDHCERLVSGANDFTMCLWDLGRDKRNLEKEVEVANGDDVEYLVCRREDHTAAVRAVAISYDDSAVPNGVWWYASASHDGDVRLYCYDPFAGSPS
jgi:WD40 repeat protein